MNSEINIDEIVVDIKSDWANIIPEKGNVQNPKNMSFTFLSGADSRSMSQTHYQSSAESCNYDTSD
jgi:hypothetical protein